MSTQVTTTCNFCGKQKGSVNHWWSIWLSGPHFVMVSFDFEKKHDDCKDACGMDCASQALSRWMNHGSLEER